MIKVFPILNLKVLDICFWLFTMSGQAEELYDAIVSQVREARVWICNSACATAA